MKDVIGLYIIEVKEKLYSLLNKKAKKHKMDQKEYLEYLIQQEDNLYEKINESAKFRKMNRLESCV